MSRTSTTERRSNYTDDSPLRTTRKRVVPPMLLPVLGLAALVLVIAGIAVAVAIRSRQSSPPSLPEVVKTNHTPWKPGAMPEREIPSKQNETEVSPRLPTISTIPNLIPNLGVASRIASDKWFKDAPVVKIAAILEHLKAASGVLLVYETNGDFVEVDGEISRTGAGVTADTWGHIVGMINLRKNSLKKIDITPPIIEKTDRRCIFVRNTERMRTIEEREFLLVESLRSQNTLNEFKKLVQRSDEDFKELKDFFDKGKIDRSYPKQ